MQEDKRNCEIHGYTSFKLKTSKKGQWWSCHKCLKLQWKKASAKRRNNPKVREYHKEYMNSVNNIRKSLSVYLTMILLAAKIKPE